MNKNKLITLRIEADKREQFKQWVKDQNLDVSEFLTLIIEACLDGRLDKNLIAILNSQSDSLNIDKLDNKLGELTNNLDNRIDKIEEQVNQLVTNLDKRIDKCIDKKLSDNIDSCIDNSIDTTETQKDSLEGSDNQQLTHAELARQINVSSSTVSRWANGKRQPPLDLEWRYNPQLKKWVK